MSYLANIVGAFALVIADELKKRAIEKSHCSEGGAVALNQIGAREHPTIEDLRASLDVETHSAATRVVARLEADQLVTKTKAIDDSRFIHLALTERGEAIRNSILTDRRHFLENALSVLDNKEREILEGLVKKILSKLPFDNRTCDRSCRLCDTGVCKDPHCPIQVNSPTE
ncbi:MarR family winged helix-turn-helix transcriptional regulator [Phyllobacterium sp. 22229]|uniref:MarR family winged helix-turn-helix transcriptional regulator n=1 Tax=Agrobacterium radiobacter TaxID=362 RepID=A0ABD5LKV7_AGRRD